VPSLHLDVGHRRWDLGIAVTALASLAVAPAFAATRFAGFAALWPLEAAFVLLGLWSGGLALRRAGWLPGGARVMGLSLSADGVWTVTDRSGRENEVVLNTASRVSGGFVYLLLEDTRHHRLLLGPGDVAAVDLRRLSVRLRLKACLAPPAPRSEAGASGDLDHASRSPHPWANFLALSESTTAALRRRFVGAEPSARNTGR
jgi:hypothetical protein